MLLALLLAVALQDVPDAPQLAELKRAWQESCADRAYGTFDDVCTQMSDQIRAYERESRKAARKPPPRAAAAPPPTPSPTTGGTGTTASARP